MRFENLRKGVWDFGAVGMRVEVQALQILQGPQKPPILWSRIPSIAIVSDTSNRPQNHVGNFF